MASIRDFAITTEAVATASMVMDMPTHVSGDLLVAFVNKDTASAFTTPSGWTAQQTQTSAGAAGGVYTKRAASASETVTFALTSETCCGVVIAVKDCNGTTEADAVSGSAKSGADDSTLPYTGIGITPGHDNCLVLHGLSTDTGMGPNALPPWVNLYAGDAGVNSLGVAYSQQFGTAAAITAPSYWGGAADDTRAFIIAIRPDTTTFTRDGYLPLSSTPCRQISPLNGSSGVVDKGTYAGVGANVITSVNGRTVTGTAVATTVDSGINPYRASARASGATSKTNYSAFEINMTATDDLTNLNGLIFFTFMNLTPSDYKDCGRISQGGKYCLFGSTSANYRAWNMGGFNCATEVSDARNNVLIEFDTTDTDLVTLGTPNFASFDIMQFGAMGYNAACAMLVNELYLLNVVTLAGGSTNNILGLDDLVFVVNNGCGILPLIVRSGVQATLWTALKFGGSESIFFSEDKKVFAYPQKADGTDFVDFHVSNNKIGIEFDGQDRGSGDVDVLHFTNCIFTSPSSYYWRFASTHDAGADIDFSGSTIINANVTLRSTSDLDSVTFIDCSTFTQNAASLTNCTFSNTAITSASPTDLELVSDCALTSAGTGYGVILGSAVAVPGSPASMDFTGNTFTGYAGSNGSTGNEAIHVLYTSGTLTINILSGGSTPSIHTAGATVNIVNARTVRVTAIDAEDASAIQNARVLLYATTGASVTITRSGSTASVSHTAHGYSNSQKVVILGANQGEYNGIKTISNVSTNAYDYTVSGTPATPATGTILSHRVILDGLTNASGILEDTAFPYVSDLAVTGRVRKGTSATYYKTAALSGTITSAAGFDTTSFMSRDT